MSFQLHGQLAGRDTGIIVLWYPDSTGTYIKDTAEVSSGQFFFTGWLRHASFTHLIGSKRDGNYASFFLEGGVQTIWLTENKFDEVEMAGSLSQLEHQQLNKVVDSMREEIKHLTAMADTIEKKAMVSGPLLPDSAVNKKVTALEEAITQEKIRFIEAHPHSFVSATELLSMLGFLSIQKADSLLMHLDKGVRESMVGVLCRQELEKMLSFKKGNRFPFFSTTTVNGDFIELGKIPAKFLLVDFWASWCVPCRKEVPAMMETYRAYRPKGFEVLAISVDKKPEQWRDAIKKDKSDVWIHLNQDASIEPLFQAVQVLPTQVLLDAQKNIIWSSLEDNAVHWTDVLKEKLR